jgi:hypothetical protein
LSKLAGFVFFPMIVMLVGLAPAGPPNSPDDDDSAKAAALITQAVKARGGDAYLNVRSVVGRGQFSPFAKGVAGLPAPFVDYVVYPDRERTEFGKGDQKYVQTNSENSGWIYDGEQKMIRDQTEDQVKNFLQNIRHDIDNLLRRGWKEPGAKLVYLGRREPWRNVFSQAVRIDFSDGAAVTIHFDLRSKLPIMSEYKTISGDGTTNDQVRFFRWLSFDGIQFPTIQDFYREGVQTARAVYESVSFNEPVPEKLFAKPENIKEVK